MVRTQAQQRVEAAAEQHDGRVVCELLGAAELEASQPLQASLAE
jgi:hypothetical protein